MKYFVMRLNGSSEVIKYDEFHGRFRQKIVDGMNKLLIHKLPGKDNIQIEDILDAIKNEYDGTTFFAMRISEEGGKVALFRSRGWEITKKIQVNPWNNMNNQSYITFIPSIRNNVSFKTLYEIYRSIEWIIAR